MGKQRAKTPAEELKELISKHSNSLKDLEKGVEGAMKSYTERKELDLEITKEELNQVLGLSQKSGLVDALFKIFDTSGDGKLQLKELIYGLAVLSGDGDIEEKLLLLFKIYDLDNSGVLERSEIQNMLQASLEENKIVLTEPSLNILIDEVFESMDPDKDGVITYDEFKDYMLTHKTREMRYLSLSGNKGASEILERHDSLVRLNKKEASKHNLKQDVSRPSTDIVIDVEDNKEKKSNVTFGEVVEMKRVSSLIIDKHDQNEPVINQDGNLDNAPHVTLKNTDIKVKAQMNVLNLSDVNHTKARKISSSVSQPMPRITYTSMAHMDTEQQGEKREKVEQPKKKEKINSETPASLKRKKQKLFAKTWMRFEGPKMFFIVMWALVCCAFFAYWFYEFTKHPFFSVLSYGLPGAKAFSSLINFNSALILLPICKVTLSTLRGVGIIGDLLPLDKNIVFHRLFAIAMAACALGHTCCHMWNFSRLSSVDYTEINSLTDQFGFEEGDNTFDYFLFRTLPGMSGILLWITIGIIFTFAFRKNTRKAHFNRFFYTHHLFFLFYALLIAHGMQTVFSFPITLSFIGFPLIVFLFERTVRCIRGLWPYEATAVAQVSRVTHLEVPKPFNYFSGQYVRINIPALSVLQWHPFTITSSPDQKVLSVDILAAGDWTSELYKLCQEKQKLGLPFPPVRVDGPFGSASEEVFKFKHIMMIGAGIGATPFISVLRHLLHVRNSNQKMKLQKAYFYWVNRDQKNFKWFADTLTELADDDPNHFLKIKTYLSQATNRNDVRSFLLWAALEEHYKKTKRDLVTGLGSRTYWGRPNFKEIFDHMAVKYPGEKIGVFFCGPQVMSKELYYLCRTKSLNNSGNTAFIYHKENF